MGASSPENNEKENTENLDSDDEVSENENTGNNNTKNENSGNNNTKSGTIGKSNSQIANPEKALKDLQIKLIQEVIKTLKNPLKKSQKKILLKKI